MKNYFKHKIENLVNVSKIVTVHFFEFDKNFVFGEEQHDFWEIVFAQKEDILCTANGREIVLEQGEMLFHKPNVRHSLRSNGIKAPDVFIVSFVCHSEAMRFFEDKKVKLSSSQKKYLYAIFEDAKKTFDIPFSNPETKKMALLTRPTLGGQQLIKNNLEILLIDIMRSLTETEEGNDIFLFDDELDNKLVNDVVKIMNEGIFENLSISQIVQKINYSRAYIFREFKKVTGKSIMEYYTDLKVKTAKKMLRETDHSIREIAEKLCFDTPNYFSKTFKKINGITPTAYKKRTRR